MDVILAFRKAIDKKNEIKRDGSNIILGNFGFNSNSITSCKCSETEFYKLCDLYYFWKTKKESSHFDQAKYLSSCTNKNVRPIPIKDQQDIYDYLNGKIPSLPSIVLNDRTKLVKYTTASKSSHAAHSEKKPSVEHKHTEGEKPVPDIKATEEKVTPVEEIEKHKKDEEILKNILYQERPSKSRDSVVKQQNSVSFAGFLSEFKEHKESTNKKEKWDEFLQTSDNSIPKDNNYNSYISSTFNGDRNDSHSYEYYIIVPPFRCNIINMYNIQQFIEQGQYIETDVLRNNRVKKSDRLTISKVINGKQCSFILTDNVKSLKKEDWSKVVCVIAGEQEWQFRDFYWKSPSEIFNKTQGIYFSYPNVPLPKTVQQWKVTRLNIPRDNRKQDLIVMNKFWSLMESYIAILKH
ncbi:hypothetical protein WA158_005309 [Blastocystis sp. Blastoise]